ncbi:DNA endonuclease RBBP8-like [Hylaeus anthracinus]|uniref:DNA endonuclease RBBP8-like n=1 Tax=Hylaeus anthracinus TaxID=313031 RepID=UPI0023B91F1C|nr:DNA endonuclease RBBP8-like [Hylaeus anthracinus]
MATSDVLQFTCSVENEFARNATKNFAGMLGKIFEDYQKLWNAYLKLLKHCEDAGIKIPCQLLESESDNSDVITLPQPYVRCKESLNKDESQMSLETTKTFTPLRESVMNPSNSDIMTNIEDSISSDKSTEEQMDENSLLRSPILAKKRCKSKKISTTQNYLILDDSETDSPCITMKENIFISANDSHKCIPKVLVEFKENECSLTENNNDKIECTPLSKMSRKLGVSTLYNVDTTLLQNGKKLKQTKLMFLPNNAISEKREPLKTLRPHISPTTKKNKTNGSKDFSGLTLVDEEVIQVSPAKHAKSNLKMKSLKLMKRSPTKFIEACNTFSKLNNDKTSDTKLPTRKLDEISLSQCPSPACASTQKDEPCLISMSNTTTSLYKKSIGNDCIRPSSLSSMTSANSEHLFPQSFKYSSTPVQETKQLQMTENGNQVQKRKFSETVKQINYSNSSVYNDETFFLLGECIKKEPISQTAEMQNTKDKTFENTLRDSPPAKRSLASSFDVVPKKKDVYVKPPKNQSERAKMTGIACWECKQYYANLGLPEEKIQARQNHCSRHRTILNQRNDTPEGFWHPLFSDTYTSTIQDGT